MIILDGKKLKNEILDELKEKVSKLKIKPNLTVIQVGDDEASNVYVEQKKKMCNYIGYTFNHIKLDSNVSEEKLLKEIDKLNRDDFVSSILVQLPLPNHIDTVKVQNAVLPVKDVDGLSDMNAGGLVHNKNCLYPCTPYGVMELLNKYNISLEGKNAVVVGRSNLVGKPMSIMLTNAGATVTVCHSKTKNLKDYTVKADILVVAVGKPKLITDDMVKDNVVVVDVGINRLDGKICGDVDFENVSKKCAYISPVPYGVGQMTVAMLAKNVLKAYNLLEGEK